MFTRDVPVPNSRQLNLTFDFGAGVTIFLNQDTAISGGYKFHHLSNAYSAPQNPGLDANIFYIGISSAR